MDSSKPSFAEEYQDDRAIVRQVINDSIGWALTKDKERLFDIMAHDADFFIFHPDSKSTIIGFEAFRQLAERAWMTDAFKATDFCHPRLEDHVFRIVHRRLVLVLSGRSRRMERSAWWMG